MFVEDFPESLTRAMLVGTMLVGRLGVPVLSRLPTSRLRNNDKTATTTTNNNDNNTSNASNASSTSKTIY